MSKGNPKTWVWDFGDGTTSIDQNPSISIISPEHIQSRLKITKDFQYRMKNGKIILLLQQVPPSLINKDFISTGSFTDARHSCSNVPMSVHQTGTSFMMNTASDTNIPVIQD
jgi:hypothetical protein